MSGISLNNNLLVNKRTPFKMEVSVTDNETFTIPQLSGYNYNYRVNWGDSNFARVTSYDDANATHTYTNAGTYVIEILGLSESIYFNNVGNKLNVTKVLQWGTTDFKVVNFYGCTNLSEIPTVKNKRELAKVTTFKYVFFHCTSLTGTIPLFLENSVNCTSLYRAFRFTNFSVIPEHLLDNLTSLTDCYGTFGDIVNVTALPNGLFKNLHITDVSECFAGDTNLQNIPADTFEGCSDLINMNSIGTGRGCFSNCNISTIPTGLLDDCINLQYCNYLFENNSISSIPTDFFKYNTNLLSVAGVFKDNSDITSIPTDLLKYNTKLTDVSYLFYWCSISTLPTDLFRYNILIQHFGRTFTGNSFSSIPTDFFKYNTKVTDFSYTFQYTPITSIPNNLFDNCPLVTTFHTTFFDCTDLISIPTNLLDNCPLVTNLESMFYGCTSLTSIPDNLITSTLHPNLTNINTCWGSCTGINTTVYEIWNDTGWSGLSHADTFTGDTNITNYADIPSDWK